MLVFNKENSLKVQVTILLLKNKYNIFTHTLIKIYHLQQWTQVSWKLIIIIQKNSLMIQETFVNIVADPYVYTRETHYIQLPLKLALHKWMEDKLPSVHRHNNVQLHHTIKM